jgi:hypothetical protein
MWRGRLACALDNTRHAAVLRLLSVIDDLFLAQGSGMERGIQMILAVGLLVRTRARAPAPHRPRHIDPATSV